MYLSISQHVFLSGHDSVGLYSSPVTKWQGELLWSVWIVRPLTIYLNDNSS